MASWGPEMARKGQRMEWGGKFKILNREPPEGQSEHKQATETRNCAQEGQDKRKIAADNRLPSLAIVLARSDCELCGEKRAVCVITEKRGVKSICSLCRGVHSHEKTKQIKTKAREVEDILGIAENKLKISKVKPRKSVRQEQLGMAAQRREEQINKLWGRIEALKTTQMDSGKIRKKGD